MRFAWVCSMSRQQHKIFECKSKKAVVKWSDFKLEVMNQKLDFPLTNLQFSFVVMKCVLSQLDV